MEISINKIEASNIPKENPNTKHRFSEYDKYSFI